MQRGALRAGKGRGQNDAPVRGAVFSPPPAAFDGACASPDSAVFEASVAADLRHPRSGRAKAKSAPRRAIPSRSCRPFEHELRGLRGLQHAQTRLNTTAAFVPPKPKEFEITLRTVRSFAS